MLLQVEVPPPPGAPGEQQQPSTTTVLLFHFLMLVCVDFGPDPVGPGFRVQSILSVVIAQLEPLSWPKCTWKAIDLLSMVCLNPLGGNNSHS